MWCVTASPSGTSSCPQVQGQPSWSCLRCVCERLTHNQGIQNPTIAALQQRIRESQSAWVGRDPKIIQHPHSAPSSAASRSSQPPSFVLPHLPGTFLAEKLNSGWKRHFNSLPFTPGSCCSSPCISLSAHSWGNFSLPWTVLTAVLAFSNPNQVLGFFLGILLLIFPVSVSLRTFSSAYSHPATLKPFCLFIFPYKHSHLWIVWGLEMFINFSGTIAEFLSSSWEIYESIFSASLLPRFCETILMFKSFCGLIKARVQLNWLRFCLQLRYGGRHPNTWTIVAGALSCHSEQGTLLE